MNFFDKLQQFSRLDNGWHYQEGIEFDFVTIASARILGELAMLVHPIDSIDMLPGLSGEILVVFYHPTLKLTLTVRPDGLFDVLGEIEDEEIGEINDVEFDCVVTLLVNAGDEDLTWNTCESYLQCTGCQEIKDSDLLLSRQQLPTRGFQSLKKSAPTRPLSQYASTSEPTLTSSHRLTSPGDS